LSLFAVRQSTSAYGTCPCLGKKIERAIERERAFILCRGYPVLAHTVYFELILQALLHMYSMTPGEKRENKITGINS